LEKGVRIMKRNLALVTFVLLLSIVFSVGCAKPPLVQKERDIAKEQAAIEQGVKGEKQAQKPVAVKKVEAGKVYGEEGAAKVAPKEAQEQAVRLGAAAAPSTRIYEFKDVNFDYDKSNLREDAREILKKHAEYLNKNKDIMIVVEGHCDERGTTEYNLALGERRASAAAKFLADMGIDVKRIKIISYGEELPLDSGHDDNAWAKNRRAHFKATGEK
jgi:peptidoglycan-associated lipoprotein